MPTFAEHDGQPVKLTEVRHPDGRMSQYPPPSRWDDWVEWDAKAWPNKVARRYTLVPTICFNCESACGLLAYVDKTTLEIRKFEGNPNHPGSRGRNCAKGPATHNQVYDPDRILYPLKRVGKRGEGRWRRVPWEEALEDIASRMHASRQKRRDGIMYHVGRPGEDHYTNRCIVAWGVDGHNSHTNVCSAAARTGYALWSGFDRPSPDYENAGCILLISSHLETGHYFNPHAQRIMDGKRKGAKLIVMDPRLSNTASKADIWLPTWPGSEAYVLLAIARDLIVSGRWDKTFVRRWVDWKGFLRNARSTITDPEVLAQLPPEGDEGTFAHFEKALAALYRDFTYERAAEEAQVPVERIKAATEAIVRAGSRLAAHNWRSASIGNLGGWQIVRALFLLNVLTGSVGTEGGTSGADWNKFVPKPFASPPQNEAWNALQMPLEWPLAHFEMSFLLPHLMEEDRGTVDVYFTRVYNPVWTNPDGFMWIKALRDEEKFGLHVALTPTWNETAAFADYVLPMGHAGERHDVMSQETHAGRWIGFRQPVRRVAMERAGKRVKYTYEANPGEVWEESEFWVELSWRMDPDGSLGVRKWFESPLRPGEPISQDEYWSYVFDNSVPGLPEAAKAEGLSPLQYMRKYGAFEVVKANYVPYEHGVKGEIGQDGLVRDGGAVVGVEIDGAPRAGFATPSRKLELLSATMVDWGWAEQQYTVPWPLESHVSPRRIDRAKGEMLLLPNFRLPTLIHTRSANAKWLYEISHHNPAWIHPSDAARLGIVDGDLLHVRTEIGAFVDKAWITEGIKPGVIAVSHHVGRWRLQPEAEGTRFSSAHATLREEGTQMSIDLNGGASAYRSIDPDTSRVWWNNVGVHQNLTHGVHPDPISGAHCWLQKAVEVRKAAPGEKYGHVEVDLKRSMDVYREWKALTRSASDHSPDGTRRPLWLRRPLKPTKAAYALPKKEGVDA
ncbi:MAG: molybdopterin-dependent oxidoreductase [Alphaproteobacteria bacterium]|nr:molybdopterin-dependent oxidoreductase [Alphaproteobacteria bacterium]MCB9697926.1 molybdopterin-dependent oxidoreductase [Alphaproteobacteria bacterium]